MNEIDDDGLRALFRRSLDRPSSPVERRAKRRAIAELLGDAGPHRVGDRYELGRRLGAGGMGVVHEGHDTTLGRRVAIKRVRNAADGLALRTLEREARTLASLSHPNIVTVHDVVVEGDDVYVVMERLDGVPLREWLGPERSQGQVLAIFEQVGRGIAAAHGAGIIHRDVKPSNVMVADDGTAKVIDFGLARAAELPHTPESTEDSGSQPTPWTKGAGTPPYMAPEQRRGETVAASDQFGLCVSLYEGLTGELPFRRGSPKGVRDGNDRARLLRVLRRAGVSRSVRRAVVRGLAVAPADRFASIDALLGALAPPRGRGAWWALGLGSVLAFGMMVVTPPYDRCAHVDAAASRWTPERYDRWQASLAARYGSRSAGELRQAHARWLADWRERARDRCEAAENRPSAAAAQQRLCVQEGLDRVEVLMAGLADGSTSPRDPLRLLEEVAAAECDESAWAVLAAAPGTFEHADPQTMRRVHALFVSSLDGDLGPQIERLQELVDGGGLEPTVRAWATARLANALTMHGEPERAVARVEAQLLELEGDADPILRGLLQAEAAAALAMLPGRSVEALSMARRAAAAIEGSPRGEPHRASVLGALAVASLRTGDPAAALEAASRGLSGLPAPSRSPVLTRARELARAQLLHLRAQAYEDLGRSTEAVASYREALRSIESCAPEHPDRARILSNLGALMGRLGEPYEADELLRRSIALKQAAGLNASAATTAMNRGNAWLRAERYERAAECYEEARALLPDDAASSLRAELVYNQAIAQQLAGRPEEAAAGYTEVLALSARDPAALGIRYGAHLGRGLALLDRSRVELARRDFEDALAIEPADVGSVDALELRLALWITEAPDDPAGMRWAVQARDAIDRDAAAASPALRRWATRFEATGRRWPPTISAPRSVPP